MPFFLEFLRDKLSRFLGKKQLSSCTSKQKQSKIASSYSQTKRRDKRSPASRVNLISKYSPVTSSPINPKNEHSSIQNSSFNSSFDRPVVISFPSDHEVPYSKPRRQSKLPNNSFGKKSPKQLSSKAKESPCQLSGIDDFPSIASTPVQKKR